MTKKIDIETLRLLIINTHLHTEIYLNYFISKLMFRQCKSSNAEPIDICNTFQKYILDNLSFNKKQTIIRELLCKKESRNQFYNIAIIETSEEDYVKKAKRIMNKVQYLNEKRNLMAHELFIIDKNIILKSITDKNFKKHIIRRSEQKNSDIIDVNKLEKTINNDFQEIAEFFKNIKFK